MDKFFQGFFMSCILMLLLASFFNSYALDIEGVIPAYSTSFVIIDKVPDVWNALGNSPAWQMLFSFEDMNIGNRDKWWYKIFGPDLEKLVLSMFAKRLAIVNMGLDIDSEPSIIFETGISIGMNQIIRIIEEILGRFGDYKITLQAGKYMDVQFHIAKNKGKEVLRYALIDDVFIIAFEQHTLEAFIEVYKQKEPSIVYDPKFNSALGEIPEERDLIAYINTELIWLTNPQKFGTFLRTLGAQEIKSIIWAIELLKTDGKQEIYVNIGEGQGVLASIPVETTMMISPHFISASTADVFLAMNLGEPLIVWNSINNALDGILASDAFEFEKDTGLDVKTDVLGFLNGEMGFAMPLLNNSVLIDNSGSILEHGTLLFFGLKDPDLCAVTMEKILKSADIPFQQMQRKGVTLYNVLPMSTSEFPVGYMLIDDLLVFGNFQQLSSILDEEIPLIASEGFTNLSSRFPQNMNAIYYLDMEALTKVLMEFPSKNTNSDNLSKINLSGQIAGTMFRDKNGFRIVSSSTTGKNWLENIGYLLTLWNIRSVLNNHY